MLVVCVQHVAVRTKEIEKHIYNKKKKKLLIVPHH